MKTKIKLRSDPESWEESVRLDLTYVDIWTIGMDISILLRAVSAVFRSSGAY